MRYALGLTVAAALLAGLFTSAFVLSDHHLFARHGWDAELYCQAADLDRAGENPYLSETFPFRLAWLYPPAMLNLFRAVCPTPVSFVRSYVVVDALLVVLAVLLWRPGADWLLALAVAVSGFGGLGWTLLSGNIDVLLLIPLSLAFAGFARARWNATAMWFGFVAAVKLLPVVYVPLVLLAPASWRERWRAVAVGVGAFAGFGALLTISRAGLTLWFFRQIFGLIRGQQSPATEFGGFRQPAFPFLTAAALGRPNDLTAIVPGILIGLVVVAGLALAGNGFAMPGPARDERRMQFALAFLAIHLLLPRLKPYSFVLLTPALFVVAREQGRLARAILLAVTCVYPAWALYVVLNRTAETPRGIWVEYSQTIALLGALIVPIFYKAAAAQLQSGGRAAATPSQQLRRRG